MNSPLVVILGAGQPFSGTEPSALRRTSGDRRVMDWVIDAFTGSLEDPEIHFVGGYRMDEIVEEYPDIHFSRNENWEVTGTVGSLLSAPLDEDRPTYVCYSDVVFEPEIVQRLEQSNEGTAIASDEQWDTRFQSRSKESRERAEKVLYKKGRVDRISTDICPDRADAEFTGLTRLSPEAVRFTFDLVDRGIIDDTDDLPDLITTLSLCGIEPQFFDVDGHWAELETAKDLSRFVLDTKANTLKRLESMVTKSKIAPQYTFTVDEFEIDPTGVCEAIREEFQHDVIVRSSTLAEDGWEESNAGRFESILDVSTDVDEELVEAIETVIDSYNDNPENQVLVQPMVDDVSASGVAMTRSVEHASPYYVINYDASTGSTETVTDGSGDDIHTVIVRKDAADQLRGASSGADNPESNVSTAVESGSTAREPDVDADGGFVTNQAYDHDIGSLAGDETLCLPSVLSAIDELETVIGHDGLDVEFAVTEEGEVYVLQVRPMTVDPGEHTVDDEAVLRAVDTARETFRESQQSSPFVFGDRTIYGIMPDWNPAEIIGRTPRNLAESLYRFLIMDDVWATQRAEFGYRDVRPQPLMTNFAGQPFVDVRADFNSFIPASVSNELAAKLVDYYLTRLENNPELHDKIEFEIAITCLPFDFEDRAEPLVEAGFTEEELHELQKGLKEITQGALERVESSRDLDDIESLERRYEQICAADLSDLDAARLLLEDCRRKGTLPFAHLARAAFVAVSLLRSLERKEVLSEEDVSKFLNSLTTVAQEFEHDGYHVAEGNMDFDAYIEKYGHLRPGTYDITSPTYASDQDGYLRPTVEAADKPGENTDPRERWDDETKAAIERELSEIGLPADCDRFISFLEDAIEGREYSKFVFSKNLSKALERIANFAEQYGFSRDEISHVTIDDLLEFNKRHPSEEVKDWMQRRVEEGRTQHTVAQAVELPPLLCQETDFLCFERPGREPNFVTTDTVRAELAEPEENEKVSLDGKIVMIPQADPGYDWLFGYDIEGLITMYGGTNSHMAIRAAEFGLPAAIGVGESLYQQLSESDIVELDCESQSVERIQ